MDKIFSLKSRIKNLFGIRFLKTSLRVKIKLYLKRIKEIEEYLEKFPDEWGRFQVEFNDELNDIFQEIMDYEKINLSLEQPEKVAKLKRLFVKKTHRIFIPEGTLAEYSFKKPYGYAGDFKIIDDIYLNHPKTKGIERLFDNYFQTTTICIAVRNRKEDFKRFIIDYVKNSSKEKIDLMNLACGPCRELRELSLENPEVFRRLNLDCYDHEPKALEYASGLLKGCKNVRFITENALRVAGASNIQKRISQKYDLIYSMGLFDYLNDKISIKLIKNLNNLLKDEKSLLVIADVRDKFCNPSVHFMEWVGEWELIYRDDENFRSLFKKAGLLDIKPYYEQQGVMQYVIAKRV